MNKNQAITAVKAADLIAVGVAATEDDIFYVKVTKAEALRLINDVFSDESTNVSIKAIVNNGVMYIN